MGVSEEPKVEFFVVPGVHFQTGLNKPLIYFPGELKALLKSQSFAEKTILVLNIQMSDKGFVEHHLGQLMCHSTPLQ
jgi:hypothetical protein